MWRRQLAGIASALAIVALAACAGGGTSSVVPVQGPQQPAGPTGASTSRLVTTTTPQKQIQAIYARKAVARGSIKDPLANWVFVEPLAVTDQAVFSVPSFVTKCAKIDPIFQGLWYLSLSNFSDPLSQITIPGCTLPATTSSDVARYHSDAVLPSGNGNVYIVEIDVGFISLTTTPVAGPAIGASTFTFGRLETNLAFQSFHLYSFFVAEYTGTGTPTTVSI